MISSFNVTVFERTFNDKGAITAQVMVPGLSGVVNAPSLAVATFIAQRRTFVAAAEDVEALTAEYNKYVFKVEPISPIASAA